MHEQASFRRVVAYACIATGFLTGIAWSLGPIGAFGHLHGLVTAACLMLPHVVSDVAAVGLVILVVSALAAGLGTIIASVVLDRRLRAMSSTTACASSRFRVRAAAAQANVDAPVIVFEHAEAHAWSRGLLHPSIWISSGALAVLADDELRAVLAHEEHHCLRRDPARLLCATVLARSFHAFPVIADAVRRMRRAVEFAADDHACTVAGPRATARALLRFTQTPALSLVAQVNGGTSVVERVQRLVGTPLGAPRADLRPRVTTAVTGCVAVACVLIVALLPGM